MTSAPIDQTAAIRHGEELDTAALESYLRGAIGVDGPLAIEQFPSGHSNLTYLLRLGARELVLRRPPFGSKVKSAHDMGREFTVLSRLHPVYA
ncbi:MAG: phosphotransferase family protein, partial [Candidatus Hydrogenedentes bacterium]|nr:phosphotransferase family protein [Candidatus Hydrogenedentota bacterium]